MKGLRQLSASVVDIETVTLLQGCSRMEALDLKLLYETVSHTFRLVYVLCVTCDDDTTVLVSAHAADLGVTLQMARAVTAFIMFTQSSRGT